MKSSSGSSDIHWKMGCLMKPFEWVSLGQMLGAALLIGFILSLQVWSPGLMSGSLLLPFLKHDQAHLPPPPVDWAAIPRLPAQPQGPDKWIVTTSINSPTNAIRILARQSGWQVVVVGDTKSPKNYSLEGVIFLNVDAQAKLGYRILNHTPFQSYARKNIGYLYAIQHGAKVIYETDDDNLLTVPDIASGFNTDLGSPGELLQYESSRGRDIVNPYVHFGQPSMWPRGYPLEAIETNKEENSYAVARIGSQLIQQGLANGDPDVDGIFRLTRKTEGRDVRVVFDSEAPPVALPPGMMSPFNSQNTLFHQGAFWGLMIPVSTAFRVCDIWRGYWAQRLLWEVGGTLSFHPPSVRQDRNIHNFFHDFLDETALYDDAGRLVSFLLQWTSDRDNFFDRILDLSKAMVRHSFWGSADAEMTLAWLQDLASLGYEPPEMRKPAPPTPKRGQFVPAVLPSSHLLPDGTLPVQPADQGLIQLGEMQRFFRGVVLIINYNHPKHSSVLFWRMIYNRIFKDIVVMSRQGDDALGIVGVPHANRGWLSYRGLPDVYNRFPEAQGYLLVNDDVVLNYWNLLGADKDKIWHIQDCTLCHFKQPGFFVYPNPAVSQGWWAQQNYTDPFNAAVDRLSQKARKRLFKRIPKGSVVVAWSDFYYVPQRIVGGMKKMIPVFAEQRVRSELAIPTILTILSSAEDFDHHAFSNSRYLWWEQRRVNPSEYYSTDLHALHPWKPSSQAQCNLILAALAKGDPQLSGFFIPPTGNNKTTPVNKTAPLEGDDKPLLFGGQ